MKHLIICLAASIALMSAASNAHAAKAGFKTAYEFGGSCMMGFGPAADKSEKSVSQAGLCIGYAIGMLDALNGRDFCVPSNITVQNILDTAMNAMSNETNENLKNHEGTYFMKKMLAKKYPCR